MTNKEGAWRNKKEKKK